MEEYNKQILKRTTSDSVFLRIHQGSLAAEFLFNEKPTYDSKKIYVLQIMVLETIYLVECILKD